MEFLIKKIEDLNTVIDYLIKNFSNTQKWLFYGPLGSGKTTLIKLLIEKIFKIKHVNSPSFIIVNEYHTGQDIVYHIDLYRIKNINELIENGIIDIIQSDKYCFIEWPNIIEDFLTNFKIVKIFINLENNHRKINIEG